MDKDKRKKQVSFVEFVGLMASLIALMALSIDTILPALPFMAKDLNVVKDNQIQYVISALFLGFTFGQVIYGPVSDSVGRKTTVYIGLVIFIGGSLISLFANNLRIMIAGRLLQGFGVASPRTISMAMTRDLYKGRDMARVTSFIMSVFIFVPAAAPALGQLILYFSHWNAIFIMLILFALVILTWIAIRLPETLHASDRKEFSLLTICKNFSKVVNNKITLGYATCAGLIFGGLIGYLNSAIQIFKEYFHVENLFPLYFAISALSIGVSSVVNSMIVRRYGMALISRYALITMITISTLFLIILTIQSHKVFIWQFMIYTPLMFFCFGMLFGNLNAIAMEPMGHIAGIASAVIGCLSSIISVTIGTIIGQAYNGTLIPLAAGFLILSASTFILQLWLTPLSKN